MNRLVLQIKRKVFQFKLQGIIADMKFYVNNIYNEIPYENEDGEIIDEVIGARTKLKNALNKLTDKIDSDKR